MDRHPVSNDHLLAGCATCARRRAAEAVREFSKGLRRMAETLNASGRHDSIREARALKARADELETGQAHLTCASCAETESDADAKFCRRCGGGLVRADEVDKDLPGTGAREWSGANNRRLRQQEDDDARRGAQRANEAIKIFKQSADLGPQGKGAADAIATFKKSANVRG